MGVYHADPSAARIVVSLDGLTLIFHRPSGATHVVAPPVPEILAALDDGPADVAAIAARLAATHELGTDALPALEARLAELEAAGLVSRA